MTDRRLPPCVPDFRRRLLAAGLAWLLLALTAFGIAAPRVALPGLYYDEAFMGQQAKDFFEPERGIHHPASTREVELFGRPFPLRNAVYLGALKSQLYLPAFALFGADTRVMRLTTLAWSLLGLLCVMLWCARILDARRAVLGGVLVAADPSYFLLSLYEWGPFTNLFLCRSAGFWLVTEGWLRGSRGALTAGGLLLGLGVYSRADAVVTLAAAALALAMLRPALVREAWKRRADTAFLALGGVVGAAPMLVSAADLLTTTSSPVIGARGDWAEKVRVLWTLGDGSHFLRLQEVGGRFDRMVDAPAPATPFALLAVLAAVLASGRAWRRWQQGAPADGEDFLVATGLLTTAGMLAIPGAVRAHHLLTVWPFFHLVLASQLLRLWELGGAGLRESAAAGEGRGARPESAAVGAPRALARIAVGCLVAALLAMDASMVARTFSRIEATGGRGRWTEAVAEPARLLEADPEARGISLDWGFHEPLLFLTRRARLEEAFWDVREVVRRDGAWRFVAGPRDLYLVHDRDYDLFGFGTPFLAAVRALAERRPDAVEIHPYHDREGGLAFYTVRIRAPHTLRYRRLFQIELGDEPPSAASRPMSPSATAAPKRSLP